MAFAPDPIARLIARLPAPDAVAVDAPDQHFAMMAELAWQIVAAPDRVCLADTPEARLVESERLVPGTAGFVAWYLRHVARPPEDAPALAALAAQLTAPYRDEWDAVWRAIEARRQTDGSFQPWPRLTVRESIERLRRESRRSGRWFDRLADIALLPSLWVLAAAGS